MSIDNTQQEAATAASEWTAFVQAYAGKGWNAYLGSSMEVMGLWKQVPTLYGNDVAIVGVWRAGDSSATIAMTCKNTQVKGPLRGRVIRYGLALDVVPQVLEDSQLVTLPAYVHPKYQVRQYQADGFRTDWYADWCILSGLEPIANPTRRRRS